MKIDKILNIEEILFQKSRKINEKLNDLFEKLPELLNVPIDRFGFQVIINDKILKENFKKDLKVEKSYPIEFHGKFYGTFKVFTLDPKFLEEKGVDNKFIFLARKIAESLWLDEIRRSELENFNKNIDNKAKWNQIVEILSQVDPYLISILSHKMLNFLLCKGYREAKQLSYEIGNWGLANEHSFIETNTLTNKTFLKNTLAYSKDIFELAFGLHIS